MTIVGSGGVKFDKFDASQRFAKDYKKLDQALQAKVNEKLRDLLCDPKPPGLRFEKLSGHSKPDIYTFHVTGNYKVSLELRRVDGVCIAFLRAVGNHDKIDRFP